MSPRSRGGAAVADQRAHGPAAEGPAPSPSDSSPRFPTLEALCAARARETGPQATCAPGERFAPPTPTAALRELAVTVVYDPDEQQERGYLVQRGDAGWRQVALVTTTDDTDTFGRLEVSETVHTVRFAGARVIVVVHGSVDEAEGEAEAWFGCEEHADPAACFEQAMTRVGEPERWEREVTFTLEGDLLVEA